MNRSYFDTQRKIMVLDQLEARGIADQRVLRAMGKVQRELFVPEDIRNFSYYDGPLPIDCGQTISQPYIIASMAEFLDIKPEDKVLEIGTGSGYNTAILSLLAAKVFTVEKQKTLSQDAQKLLREQNYDNIEFKTGDGLEGWPDNSPYDCILLTAAVEKTPIKLINQLAPNGRLLAPEGKGKQFLFLYKKSGSEVEKSMLIPVKFMPMEEGHWQGDENGHGHRPDSSSHPQP